MIKKIQIRKINLKEVKTVAILHQKTLFGLSSKLGEDYLLNFYKILIGYPKIHFCLAAIKNDEIIGVITITRDDKKTQRLLHSLLSFQIILRILIGVIRGKISLQGIINRFRLEKFIERQLKPSYVRILTVFIEKKYQRQGIGRLLLQSILNHQRKLKNYKLYVDTRANNYGAIKFYQKSGFSIRNIVFDAVIMEYKSKILT
jgi:ribosomal protein S18 acetylase RimI-like enzyme